jgi:hypothetical protein
MSKRRSRNEKRVKIVKKPQSEINYIIKLRNIDTEKYF